MRGCRHNQWHVYKVLYTRHRVAVYMRTWKLVDARTMNENELRGYIFELEYAVAEARDLLEGMLQ